MGTLDQSDLACSRIARLRAAGVPAEHVRWAGHVHGSLGMTRLVPSARDWQERSHELLRTHLA